MTKMKENTKFREFQNIKNNKLYGKYELHLCEENIERSRDCEKKDFAFLNYYIYKKDSDWTIESGSGYHNIDDIDYCPFCGEKLK